MNLKLISALAVCVAAPALAKLPPLDDAAKAKAAEAAAKTAWQGKVDAFLLCKSQDKVVAHVNKAPKGKGAAASTCADPGAFVYPPPDPSKATAAAPAASAPAAKPGAAAPAKKS